MSSLKIKNIEISFHQREEGNFLAIYEDGKTIMKIALKESGYFLLRKWGVRVEYYSGWESVEFKRVRRSKKKEPQYFEYCGIEGFKEAPIEYMSIGE